MVIIPLVPNWGQHLAPLVPVLAAELLLSNSKASLYISIHRQTSKQSSQVDMSSKNIYASIQSRISIDRLCSKALDGDEG